MSGGTADPLTPPVSRRILLSCRTENTQYYLYNDRTLVCASSDTSTEPEWRRNGAVINGIWDPVIGISTLDITTSQQGYYTCTLVTGTIHPKVEYASSVWSPIFKKIDTLERVQRSATKCVSCLSHFAYSERMRALGLICLENRRKRADSILTWKILNSHLSNNFDIPLTLRAVNRFRDHSLHLVPPQNRPVMTSVRMNVFTERVANVWNQLPEEGISAPSLSTFKGKLDKFYRNERNLLPCS
ncbi:hypothetical protein LOD99_10849 [Oopsacas minuta]|uniref:Ig-like domain-containing protein n=1 Tax=Oopsacas minuta TaxID=111878 RepID=A0AAV7KCP5_9METZ|nr:hypothetical protein LOD99_10849 [Oopsacas minuta]